MFLLGSYTAAALISLMHDSSLAALIASKVQPEWHISSAFLCLNYFVVVGLFAHIFLLLCTFCTAPRFERTIISVLCMSCTRCRFDDKADFDCFMRLVNCNGMYQRKVYLHPGYIFCFQGFQAGTNYRNGHTGQLSTLSVLLSWAGGLGVTFVSLQVLYTDRNIVVQLVTIPICLCCLSLRLSYFYSFIFCLLGTRKSNFFLVTYTPHLSQLCLAGPGPLLQEQPGRH